MIDGRIVSFMLVKLEESFQKEEREQSQGRVPDDSRGSHASGLGQHVKKRSTKHAASGEAQVNL
jgi:hypothetical protein